MSKKLIYNLTVYIKTLVLYGVQNTDQNKQISKGKVSILSFKIFLFLDYGEKTIKGLMWWS